MLKNSFIIRRIKQLFPDKSVGFSGGCFAAAVKINKEVLGGKGEVVAAYNEFMLDQLDEFIGHVAVFYNNVYWDVDARPKPWEQIESWGVIDQTTFDEAMGDYADMFGKDEDALEQVGKIIGEKRIVRWFNSDTRIFK